MYQHQAAFNKGRLRVSDLHELKYEEYGKKDGLPAIFLHGGPGGTTSIANSVFFDPQVYRVLIFDQRGAGQSTPSAEIRENTSQHLVEDIERLRKHLDIPKWHLVFGGSWGSFLGLMYAQSHPDKVGSIILRGVFTGRKRELEFHRGPTGAAMLFPAEYADFIKPLPVEDHPDPVEGHWKLLHSPDEKVRRASSRAFNAWDIMTVRLRPEDEDWSKLDDDQWCLQHAMIECHYFRNECFVEDGELLSEENMAKVKHIPATIVQGQWDICTAPLTAWDLHQRWPGSKLRMIPAAGHTVKEPGIAEALVKACDEHAKL